MMLKGEGEKDSMKKMVSSLESQVSSLQATVKALQENLAERDNIDEELNSDIEGLKRQVTERDATIAQLRMHFQQRNRIDEQLSSDIISLKKNIAEKNNAISELLKNNRSLVEMSRASDFAAKDRGDALSMARNETDKLKREIERLNSLIQKQQAEHKKTADDLSAGFELQKQMMLEESTEKEVALNTRIKELEELLEDAKRSMQARNEEMASMVKNLNEQSRTLLSNMSKPIAEAPPDEFNIMPPRGIRKPMKQARVITQQPAKGIWEKIKPEAAAVAPPPFTQRGRISEIISAIDIASLKQPIEKIRQSLLSSGYSASEIDEAIARWNSQNKK
jgi:DNA repair exonuclease SbcCD ATPase subunit